MPSASTFPDDPHFTFRVVRFMQNPAVGLEPTLPWFFEVEHTSGKGVRYGLTTERYQRYRDALRDALATQAIYWANLDFSRESRFSDANTLDRLLDAVKDRQLEPDV